MFRGNLVGLFYQPLLESDEKCFEIPFNNSRMADDVSLYRAGVDEGISTVTVFP